MVRDVEADVSQVRWLYLRYRKGSEDRGEKEKVNTTPLDTRFAVLERIWGHDGEYDAA